MLHLWVIPTVVIMLVVVLVLYLVIKASGGTGARTAGRVLVDDPEVTRTPDEEP